MTTLTPATDYAFQYGNEPRRLTRSEYEAASAQAGVSVISDAEIAASWVLSGADYNAAEWAAFTRERRVEQVLGQARRRTLDDEVEARRSEPAARATQIPASGSTCRRCGGPAADGSGDCGECR